MKNWNRVNDESHNLPEVLYTALTRVVGKYIEWERKVYETCEKVESENHIYLDLHCLDFWLRTIRHKHLKPDRYLREDYPMCLRTLGRLQVSPGAAMIVSQHDRERILEAHRLYPWGMTVDASAGESARYEIEALSEHNGVLRSRHSIPGRTCEYEVEVETTLSTTTAITVKETPISGPHGYDDPGHRIDRNHSDIS